VKINGERKVISNLIQLTRILIGFIYLAQD